jgi:RsiW-degrading membrane proteinase PrsW (M82 family)
VAATVTAPSSPSPATRSVRPSTPTERRLLGSGFLLLFAGTVLLCFWQLAGLLRSRLGLEAIGYAAEYAIIPVIPIAVALWWLQRRRPEPRWCLIVAFTWGVVVASYVSMQLNEFVAERVARYTPTSWAAIFIAPWVEESAKGAVVFAIVLWRRHDFGGVVSGAVYAGLSAIGFAFAENVIYYGREYRVVRVNHGSHATALDALQYLFRFRGLETPYVHPLFTIMTGIGIGIAVRAHRRATRIVAPAAGFCLAALLHMSYNSMATFATRSREFNALAFLVLMPVAVLVAGLLLFARRHEGAVLAARLRDFDRFGWLKESTIPYIVEPRGRRQARRHARRLGGAELDLVRAYQRTGMDLAVLRDRMVRGVAGPKDLERERVLIETLREQRRRVHLPAAAGSWQPSITTISSW